MRSPPQPIDQVEVDGRIEVEKISMKRARDVLRRLRKNQKGFTLIEMLVVISILGILAAVVTLSMVGVTAFAHSRALQTEQSTIQTAFDTLAGVLGETPDQLCATSTATSASTATSNMKAFPSTTNPLNPTYVRLATTQQAYYCDTSGTIQHT